MVVVDDSLVRGNTSKELVQMIRAAGAREVHLRLGSPPITGPCHYGIDTPTREELIGADPLDRGDPPVPGRGLAGLPLARRHAAGGGRGHRVLSRLLLRASTRPRLRTSWCDFGTRHRSIATPA